MIFPISGKFCGIRAEIRETDKLSLQKNLEICSKKPFPKSRKWGEQISSMYLCDLCSNMCNTSFHSGLNPSSATLFTTWGLNHRCYLVAKDSAFGSNNRLKPCCNLGLNGVSTLGSSRAAPSFQTCCKQKNTEILLSVFANFGLEPWLTQGGTVRA